MALRNLAFYFDTDDNGVVKGDELKRLKIWIDIDGDAVTDKGELVPLSKHGITEIVIPGHHKMVSTTKIQEWKGGNAKSSTNKVSLGENSGAVMDGLPTQVIGSDASTMIDKGTSGVRIQSQAQGQKSIFMTRKQI